jgi:hypothetical protein
LSLCVSGAITDAAGDDGALRLACVEVDHRSSRSSDWYTAESTETVDRLRIDASRFALAYGVVNPGAPPERQLARRYTFYIDPTGKIADIDKAVKPASSGQDILAKLTKLKGPLVLSAVFAFYVPLIFFRASATRSRSMSPSPQYCTNRR